MIAHEAGYSFIQVLMGIMTGPGTFLLKDMSIARGEPRLFGPNLSKMYRVSLILSTVGSISICRDSSNDSFKGYQKSAFRGSPN
jgi:hypothetical protein